MRKDFKDIRREAKLEYCSKVNGRSTIIGPEYAAIIRPLYWNKIILELQVWKMRYIRWYIHHLHIYRMFQILPKKDRTCLEGYEKKKGNKIIEDELKVILTQLFYQTRYLVRDGCNPSPYPQLHQNRRNRGSGK